MQKWEYKIICLTDLLGLKNAPSSYWKKEGQEYLSELGFEGWEMVTICADYGSDDYGSDDGFVFFKRKVDKERGEDD